MSQTVSVTYREPFTIDAAGEPYKITAAVLLRNEAPDDTAAIAITTQADGVAVPINAPLLVAPHLLANYVGDVDRGDRLQVRVSYFVGDSQNARTIYLPELAIGLPSASGNLIAIDHDYGGTDRLRVVSTAGSPVAGATLSIYAAAAFAADPTTAPILDQSTTGFDGRWLTPVMLPPGSYAIVASKAGAIRSTSVTITVY